MKAPAPFWEIEYHHDRRAHRHRCRCCSRIIEAGEQVIQARIGEQRTLTIHATCGDLRHGTAAWTWRDAMRFWGLEYLKACGWKVELPPIERAA